jgi:hypothetical protein
MGERRILDTSGNPRSVGKCQTHSRIKGATPSKNFTMLIAHRSTRQKKKKTKKKPKTKGKFNEKLSHRGGVFFGFKRAGLCRGL